jgi:outer membrane lipoprotein-sorting protein
MNKIDLYKYLLILGMSIVVYSCASDDPPVVTTFSPEFGSAETLITVEGNNFNDLLAIDFNDDIAADFNPSFGTESALLFRAPPNATVGDNNIQIITDDGMTSFPFRVTLDAPSVFDFNPKSANISDTVFITGKNFFEPLEVLFFDSIPGNIIHSQVDSLAVLVPTGVQRGRIRVVANGGFSETAEMFFTTREILVNNFDGGGVRSETDKWLFYGNIEQNATNAILSELPDAIDGNFLKISGFDPGSVWVGGTESHSNDPTVFDVFDIVSNINDTFIELDVNNNGSDDTHLIIVLAERNGSINDFTETIAIDWEGWGRISLPLNRFSDINGVTPDPQKIRTVKLHLFNELNSSQKMEANVDNLKFIEIL